MADLLERMDAAIEGRCAGPRCGRTLPADSGSAYFCGPVCQQLWNRQRTHRPEEVCGDDGVDPSEMRWRPDLVSAFDNSDLELVEGLSPDGRGHTRRWYRHADGRRFLYLDDGHRFVGAYVDGEGEDAGHELWRRLERELTDGRRLDPGPSNPPLAPMLLTGQTTEEFARALRRVGEHIVAAGAGAIAAYEALPAATQRAIQEAAHAESDRLALRAVCNDEAMYGRALAAAADRGMSVRQILAAVVEGRYVDSGWAEPDALPRRSTIAVWFVAHRGIVRRDGLWSWLASWPKVWWHRRRHAWLWVSGLWGGCPGHGRRSCFPCDWERGMSGEERWQRAGRSS